MLRVFGKIRYGLFALRKFFTGGVYHSNVRLDNKTVLITGGNSGIGKETAKNLAKRGARVLLACQDRCRAEKAAEEIRQYSGNQDVHIYIVNLASLASVRKCAKEVIAKEERLDILLNNAGVFGCPYMKTEDGFEMHFGINHLGHFLFTILLLDLLKSSTPSRIINVSSRGHTRGRMNFDDVNSERSYGFMAAYRQSKLANILFTKELSKRLQGTGVTVNALHPGVILTPIVKHIIPDGSLYKRLADILHSCIFWFFLKDIHQGAQTSIFCSVAPEIETVSGKYFCDCALKETAAHAQDDEVAAKLWSLSQKMVGLTD